MFGFKRTKPPAFTEVLDEISQPQTESETVEPALVAPSAIKQPQDWLLRLLSGMVKEKESNTAQAMPPVYEASYLENEVTPLLEAIANCEQEAIAEELGLSEKLSRSDLNRIRRDFARANHPDRLHPSQRELATHRMTIANMLIDRELMHKPAIR